MSASRRENRIARRRPHSSLPVRRKRSVNGGPLTWSGRPTHHPRYYALAVGRRSPMGAQSADRHYRQAPFPTCCRGKSCSIRLGESDYLLFEICRSSQWAQFSCKPPCSTIGLPAWDSRTRVLVRIVPSTFGLEPSPAGAQNSEVPWYIIYG